MRILCCTVSHPCFGRGSFLMGTTELRVPVGCFGIIHMALITRQHGSRFIGVEKGLRLRVPSDIPRTVVMAEVETCYPGIP
jgi:hypothetical protein